MYPSIKFIAKQFQRQMLPIHIAFLLSKGHTVAAYFFFLVPHFHPSLYLSFNTVPCQTVPTSDVTNSYSLPSFNFTYYIPLLVDSM